MEARSLGTALRNASECSPPCIVPEQPVDPASVRLPINFSKPIKVDLPISCAGAFVYWVEFDGEVPDTRVKGREGYFNVDPILLVKPRVPILSPDLVINPKRDLKSEHVNLPLDGISMITLVSKWMGPVSGWRNHFQEANDRGYNMIHWTPIQERGESDSPYSIRNQLAYDPSMFNDKSDFEKDGGASKVEELIHIAREEYGLLSLTDVVLNHTSNDCPWLSEHPEAGL
jgi:glycogen debranching enzyme